MLDYAILTLSTPSENVRDYVTYLLRWLLRIFFKQWYKTLCEYCQQFCIFKITSVKSKIPCGVWKNIYICISCVKVLLCCNTCYNVVVMNEWVVAFSKGLMVDLHNMCWGLAKIAYHLQLPESARIFVCAYNYAKGNINMLMLTCSCEKKLGNKRYTTEWPILLLLHLLQ